MRNWPENLLPEGMMMQFERSLSLRRRRGLNLTSLIDVIFLLVIFFMLTSKYMTYELVRLRLSTTRSSTIENVSSGVPVLFIRLAPDGAYIMDNTRYTLALLAQRIRSLTASENAQNVSVVLTPEKTVTVQQVLRAMEQLKHLGIQTISLVESP